MGKLQATDSEKDREREYVRAIDDDWRSVTKTGEERCSV